MVLGSTDGVVALILTSCERDYNQHEFLYWRFETSSKAKRGKAEHCILVEDCKNTDIYFKDHLY